MATAHYPCDPVLLQQGVDSAGQSSSDSLATLMHGSQIKLHVTDNYAVIGQVTGGLCVLLA